MVEQLISIHSKRLRTGETRFLTLGYLRPPGLSSLSEKLLRALHTNFGVTIGKNIR